jgi:hypothetical protein
MSWRARQAVVRMVRARSRWVGSGVFRAAK